MASTKKRKFTEDDLTISDNVGENWKQLFNSGKITQSDEIATKFVRKCSMISSTSKIDNFSWDN